MSGPVWTVLRCPTLGNTGEKGRCGPVGKQQRVLQLPQPTPSHGGALCTYTLRLNFMLLLISNESVFSCTWFYIGNKPVFKSIEVFYV